MKYSLIWSLAILTAGLTACAQPGEGPSDRHADTTMEKTLTAYHWELDRIVDENGAAQASGTLPHGQSGAPMTLAFQAQRLSVTGLCNVLSAAYSTQGDNMRIRQVVSTMRMCPDTALMRHEHAIANRLPDVATWHVAQADNAAQPLTLTLAFSNGGQWVLQGKPTPETRYGSAGEIRFLEVAPQTITCSHPLIPKAQCLNVRAVQYDASGLKTGEGPWHALQGDIEGYHHEPGVRNVLRVKRFVRSDTPADAPDQVYVLDMVVESEHAAGQYSSE